MQYKASVIINNKAYYLDNDIISPTSKNLFVKRGNKNQNNTCMY